MIAISRKLCSLVVSTALVIGPEAVACAQTSTDADFSHAPTTGWDSSKMSPAVMDNLNKVVTSYAQKKHAGKTTASDVEVAAAAMKTAFDHLQEIGFNKALETKLLANQEAFVDYHPSDADLQSWQKQFVAQGLSFDTARIRNTLDMDYESRLAFLSLVKTQGLYKTELQLVRDFRTQELQFVSTSSSGLGTSLANRQPQGGHEVRVMSYALAVCLVAAGIGIGTGCAIAPACVTAMIACGACVLSGAC